MHYKMYQTLIVLHLVLRSIQLTYKLCYNSIAGQVAETVEVPVAALMNGCL